MIEKDLFSDELKGVVEYIEKDLSSYDFPTVVLTTEYFFMGVLNIQCDANKTLNYLIPFNNLNTISLSIGNYLSGKSLSAIKPRRAKKYDATLEHYFNCGVDEMKAVGASKLSTDHIMLSIIKDYENKENRIGKILHAKKITYETYLSAIEESKKQQKNTVQNPLQARQKFDVFVDTSDIEDGSAVMLKTPNGEFVNLTGFPNPDDIIAKLASGKITLKDVENERKKIMKAKNGSYIENFCTNLNNLAENGKIEQIVGRENETSEIIRTLGRRKKNNIILVGDGGVGKTVIAENLALKIVKKDVPNFLLNKIIISLDATALAAGTTLRGMFEERVKGLLNEIKESGNYILFIDNIGNVLSDKGRNDYDISGMISHSLDVGELQVIGTCDYKSYRSTFDSNSSLSRKFQKITISTPTESESIKILKQTKTYYEDFHNVKYTDKAIELCVTLTNKYIPERNLPDSAIDVLDEAGSSVSIKYGENETVKSLQAHLNNILEEINKETAKENYKRVDELTEIKKSLENQISKENDSFQKKRKENPETVDENVIREIISKKTNIPISKLSSNDKERLNGINDRLKAEIIGQDEAIDTICRSIKRNRVGLTNSKCLYSSMNIGATGVGKTLIAKKLAKEMFGSEDALIRFDMSEYPDKTAVNKLIGSNPGYVGYEDGGLLTEAVKNKKYCVLLIDEIEKADPQVYNIFLQVLDEGFLTDNSGMRVDFKNVIVLFTSNVGTKAASDFGNGIGFVSDNDLNQKKILRKELKNRFPPEFINRLNDVIYFNRLTDDNLKDIIKINLGKLSERLKKIGFVMSYDDNVVDYILSIVSEEKEFGARPVDRAIEDEIENKITDLLLSHEYNNGHVFNISVSENKIFVE